MVGVLHQCDGGIADLGQVESADVAGHAHGDTLVGRDQDIGEGGREEGRLLQLAVVVVYEVHRILVDVTEQLPADPIQPGLRIPAGRPGHIPGVDLTEVALGVHERVEQCPVALGHAYHGVVDGRIPMGVQLHGGAHDIGALGPSPAQQVHLIHGIEQLAVAGLETIDLRNCPGNDDAHGVGHVVILQGITDGLLLHLRFKALDMQVLRAHPGRLRSRLFVFSGSHRCSAPFQEISARSRNRCPSLAI